MLNPHLWKKENYEKDIDIIRNRNIRILQL